MALKLSDYLAYVRSQALPSYFPTAAMPAQATTGEFGTRSSVTADGGSSATGEGAISSPGDTSLSGRLALNADLNISPVSATKAAFGVMGLLSGPLGSLAMTGLPGVKSGPLGGFQGMVNAHNQSAINNALATMGFRVGIDPPEVVAEAINAALNAPNTGLAPSAFSLTNVPGVLSGFGFGVQGHPAFGMQGFNVPSPTPAPFSLTPNITGPKASDVEANPTSTTGDTNADSGIGAAAAADAAAGGSGAASGGVTVHQGGMIQDRQSRPNREEAATLQEGEYVIRRERAQRFRPLLEKINKGSERQIKRALKDALTAVE